VLVAMVVVVVVAPVFTEEVEVVVVVSLAANGDKVGSLIGEVVGDRVAAGEDVPQPFATLISTSAQFQNCSGTPRPSGGITSQTGRSPG